MFLSHSIFLSSPASSVLPPVSREAVPQTSGVLLESWGLLAARRPPGATGCFWRRYTYGSVLPSSLEEQGGAICCWPTFRADATARDSRPPVRLHVSPPQGRARSPLLPASRSGGSSPEPGHGVWQAVSGCKGYSCALAGGRGLFPNRAVDLSRSQLAIYCSVFLQETKFPPRWIAYTYWSYLGKFMSFCSLKRIDTWAGIFVIIIYFRTEITNSHVTNWQFSHSEIESSSRNWTNEAA